MPTTENDAPCLHVRVTLIYAPPGGRWACDSCGASFHPAALSCVIPPGWDPTPPEGGYSAEDF